MKKLYTARLILLGLFLFALNACTSLNSTVGGYFDLDTDLQLTFKVDADINPDERKKPSPLFIRMYELKSTKMFKKADFIDLYERDEEVLGADLISKQKLKRLKPGEGREQHFVLDKKTRYIALYAEFLRYKDAQYRVIIPVVPNNVVRTSSTVKVAGNTLTVTDGSDDDDEDTESSLTSAKQKSKKAKASADKAQEGAEKLDKLF